MHGRIIAAAAASAMLIAGCTISYKTAGRYQDTDERFIGDVQASVFGGGDVTARLLESGETCEGRAEADNAFAMSCSGQTGTIHMQCSDGRVVDGTWTATSCTSGVGTAHDQAGRAIEFVFGLTEQEARDYVAQ